MFDGASNVQLGSELLKIHYPKIVVMYGAEHTVSFFPMTFSKYQLKTRELYLISQYKTY